MSAQPLTISEMAELLRIGEEEETPEEREWRTTRIASDEDFEFLRTSEVDLPDHRHECLRRCVADAGFQTFGRWCSVRFDRGPSARMAKTLIEALAIRHDRTIQEIGGLRPDEACALYEGKIEVLGSRNTRVSPENLGLTAENPPSPSAARNVATVGSQVADALPPASVEGEPAQDVREPASTEATRNERRTSTASARRKRKNGETAFLLTAALTCLAGKQEWEKKNGEIIEMAGISRSSFYLLKKKTRRSEP